MFAVDEEGHSCEKKTDSHEGKGCKEEVSTTESIDCVDCWNSEKPVDDTRTERYKEGVWTAKVCVDEDLSGVVSNDIDPAELRNVRLGKWRRGR